ncbi:MAG: hypothetical protein ABL958_19000 [Bdellovibrionia bacterium]
MTNKAQTAILILGLTLVAACGSSGGGGDKAKPSILGEATKPGYLPDGTKTQPLTKEQNQEFVKTIGSVNTVRSGVNQASQKQKPEGRIANLSAATEEGPNQNMGANLPVFGVDESRAKKIGQVIVDSCSLSASGTPPKENASGKVSSKIIIAARGQRCPTEFKVDITADGTQTSGQNSGSSNMVVETSVGFEVKHAGMVKANGLKSSDVKLIAHMAASGSESGSSLSMSISGTESAKVLVKDRYSDIKGQILFEANASGKSNNGNGPNDVNLSLRAVSIYDYAGMKVLLQIFVTMTNGTSKIEAYINGQEVTDKKLISSMANSPGIQSSLESALALEGN